MRIYTLFACILFTCGAQTYDLPISCVDKPTTVSLITGGPGTSGTILFFSGGGGTKLWGRRKSAIKIINTLQEVGYLTVQVKWGRSWMKGSSGVKALSCRPSEVIQWVYDNLHQSGAFCATGNSAGAAQIGYALAHHGMSDILDAVVLSGGPPLSRVDKGCLTEGQFAYTDRGRRRIDSSFHDGRSGPCTTRDITARQKFKQSSINVDGEYTYDTHVSFVFGEYDVGTPFNQ